MKSSLIKNNLVLLCLCVLFSGCKPSSNEMYLNKTEDDWKAYLSEISGKQEPSLKNTVLLVLKSSECSPALNELKSWNALDETNSEVRVKIVIVERYATTTKVLLEQEGINLPMYQDSIALVLRKELLPATPIKVFIDDKGNVKRLAAIDSRTKIEDFLTFN
ncbi:TlpA family protein disulfide reductase [Gracilimonas sp.]|uniref:TlpA family protein disulfide reductase n=1 Tax=Gracilimonas sp. TaxID=1974203 RepID=UPI00375295D6